VTTGEYPLLYVFVFAIPTASAFFFDEEGRVGYTLPTLIPPGSELGQEVCDLCRITSERRAGEIVYVCMYLHFPSSKDTRWENMVMLA
jgi:hypothetical protein